MQSDSALLDILVYVSSQYDVLPACSLLEQDLLACAMRDPSIPGVLAAFLFSKGFHAVATYRIAHSLYT
jgi:serine acetyltransferase